MLFFAVVPSCPREWKYIYTLVQPFDIFGKKRKSVTTVMYKRPHIHLVQCSPALTAGWRQKKSAERAAACSIQFNLFAAEIYMHSSMLCSMQSLSTNDYSCANTLFLYFLPSGFLLVLHCCKWCFCIDMVSSLSQRDRSSIIRMQYFTHSTID